MPLTATVALPVLVIVTACAGDVVPIDCPPKSIAVALRDSVLVATSSNVAVTALAATIDTLHAPMPEHAPLQPAKIEPAAGAAASDTRMVSGTDSLQSLPQLTTVPASVVPVTVPPPLPARVTESTCRGAAPIVSICPRSSPA